MVQGAGDTGDGNGEGPTPLPAFVSGRGQPVGTGQGQAVEALHRHGGWGASLGQVVLSISEGWPLSRDVPDETDVADWE